MFHRAQFPMKQKRFRRKQRKLHPLIPSTTYQHMRPLSREEPVSIYSLSLWCCNLGGIFHTLYSCRFSAPAALCDFQNACTVSVIVFYACCVIPQMYCAHLSATTGHPAITYIRLVFQPDRFIIVVHCSIVKPQSAYIRPMRPKYDKQASDGSRRLWLSPKYTPSRRSVPDWPDTARPRW